MKTQKIKHRNLNLDLRLRNYSNNRTAIELLHQGDPYAVATVNIPEVELRDDEVLIKDYSENEGILNSLITAGIVTPTSKMVSSGFVTLPVCKLLI